MVWGTNGQHSSKTKDARYQKGVITQLAPTTEQRRHATQKPVGVMRHLFSIMPGGATVLDPFMGSGTTGVAAVENGQKFIGIEKEPHYFDVAVERVRAAYASREAVNS